MIVGYQRVSSADQNEARQLDGMTLDKCFLDKISGKDMNRPALQAALEFCREGDTLICHSMDRLARNLDDLRGIVFGLTKRGVKVQFVKECLTFSSETDAMSNLLLSMLGAFAEFERSLIRERQREGIAIAKREGKFKGRQRTMDATQIAEIKKLASEGINKATIARDFGVSRQTIYSMLAIG